MAAIAPLSASPAGLAAQLAQVNPATLEKAGAGLEVGRTAPAGGPSFANLLQNFTTEVDGKMQAARVEQAKVLTGESTSLHQAMISMQEASVAFTLMVEVRNKLVESYQEMMRMQV